MMVVAMTMNRTMMRVLEDDHDMDRAITANMFQRDRGYLQASL